MGICAQLSRPLRAGLFAVPLSPQNTPRLATPAPKSAPHGWNHSLGCGLNGTVATPRRAQEKAPIGGGWGWRAAPQGPWPREGAVPPGRPWGKELPQTGGCGHQPAFHGAATAPPDAQGASCGSDAWGLDGPQTVPRNTMFLNETGCGSDASGPVLRVGEVGTPSISATSMRHHFYG